MQHHALHWMSMALRLAEKGLYTTDPNPRVGCVIVKDNQLIGSGFHYLAGEAHAEINALSSIDATDAEAFVTLEPCAHVGKTPPCVEALIEAKIKKVHIAMTDPNPLVSGKGVAMLEAAGISTHVGLMEKEARLLNRGFIKRMETKKPFVMLKTAMSLDGRTAMASGESQWITGDAARKKVQHLRGQSSAILTGVGTILADNPRLDVRAFDTIRPPARVILDTHLRTPIDAQIFHTAGEVVLMCAQADHQKRNSFEAIGAKVVEMPTDSDAIGLDLHAVLDWLGDQEINHLMVEAGSILSGRLLQMDLVDELVIFVAPKLLGDHARGAFVLPFDTMSQAINWHITDTRAMGDDWMWVLLPKNN